MRKISFGIIAGSALLLAGTAQATVITFDTLNANGKLASIAPSNPYAGFNWSSSWYLGDTTVAGYSNGAHSGADFVTNGFGVNNLGISSSAPFDFSGAWFAIPNTNGAKAGWINISAFDSTNQLIGSTGNIAIGADYAFVAANFSHVSRLNIMRDRGWFVMDDLVFSRAAEAPEPASIALTGLGLAALIGVLRRKRSVA